MAHTLLRPRIVAYVCHVYTQFVCLCATIKYIKHKQIVLLAKICPTKNDHKKHKNQYNSPVSYITKGLNQGVS